MINQRENLIFINGENKTPQIGAIQFNNNMYTVIFTNSNKSYNYSPSKIEWLKDPEKINPEKYIIKINGFAQSGIKSVSKFSKLFKSYYFICFNNGFQKLYQGNEIKISESVLKEPKSKKVFEYLIQTAEINQLKTEDGINILFKLYQEITEISSDCVLAKYLNPQRYRLKSIKPEKLIFPFGCNQSQYNAVKQAFESQLSVIQGPPGTGKTQTILNIIANILVNQKSVIVVSNNNSATDNVLEKLQKYGFGFLVAPLGNSENKQHFLESVTSRSLPDDFSQWKLDDCNIQEKISQQMVEIADFFSKQERLAVVRQEISQWKLEWEHYKAENKVGNIEITNSANPKVISELLNLQQYILKYGNTKLGKIKWFFQRLKYKFIHKVDTELLEFPSENSVRKTQILFYSQKILQLENELAALETYFKSIDTQAKINTLTSLSMAVLKNAVYTNHDFKTNVDTEYALNHDSVNFLKEFPIVLSTTFSAVSSVKNAFYDYLIMDEASQVTIETGALALSCAKNAVIVGDTMQLPNVLTEDDKQKLDSIIKKYDIESGYDSSKNSFLESVLKVISDIPQTLLKEHYRCAPEIINFCNQKYYGGRLVVMTQKTDDKAVSAFKTVEGNHCRGHENQREIDVICKEILPAISYNPEEIGIIAPYNSQVNAIKKYVDPKIEVATVHKFQGREKDVIIMSVTDDKIGEFVDNPNLLNVAVSRAKKLFYLTVTGNKQDKKGNICDLLDYIEYNGGTITASNICSVYDMLYKQYALRRTEFFKNRKRISQYDSENLTYYLIIEIINGENKFSGLGVILNYPLNLLISDKSQLSNEEQKYVSHPSTHVDFLIYSRVSKKAVLTVEVDGWHFHQDGSKQSERDEMKNHILSVYGIELLRLSTTGSNEKELITNKLSELVE